MAVPLIKRLILASLSSFVSKMDYIVGDEYL